MTETELDAANAITEPRRIWTTVVAVCRHESVLLVILLVAVLIVGGLFEPAVFQAGNLANVSRNAAIIGIGGVGMTFVLLAGELDLSIGSIMSLSLVIGGRFLDHGAVVALVATALCGVVLGAINGFAVGYGRVNSLIMTLGTLALYSGLAGLVTRGQAIYLLETKAYTWLGTGDVAGVPVPVLLFVAVVAVGTLVLSSMGIGRRIYFTGTNPVAAWYSGINVARTKLFVFMVSGLLAAMAGPPMASLTNRITPGTGAGFELGAIAVAVLGGTALAGGRGSVVGTAVGALIFALVSNILALSGSSTYTNQVVRGCLLIFVVLVIQRAVRGRVLRPAA